MKKLLFVAILAVAVLVVLSIGKKPLTERFENLVEATEEQMDKFTEQDWEKQNAKFSELVKEYKSKIENIDKEDRAEIDKAIGKYHALALKSGINEIAESATTIFDNITSTVDGFVDGLKTILNQ